MILVSIKWTAIRLDTLTYHLIRSGVSVFLNFSKVVHIDPKLPQANDIPVRPCHQCVIA